MTGKKLEEVETVLGKPVLVEFPESTSKIRLNLLITSCIVLALVILDVKVNPNSTIFGLQFEGITMRKVQWGLLAVNLYVWVHFFWCTWDGWSEWRLRLTGTKVAFITAGTFGSEHADYPTEPRQSTLYNWWLSMSTRLQSWTEAFEEIRGHIRRIEGSCRSAKDSDFYAG